ncbi:MAG: FAD:protein FMN transferase, partial [Gammaproteobacteria bacterium]|nr:FAD:protein FMN transferase [Gammaproteobacteria bacterium]
EWSGAALGAPARIILHHPERAQARAAVAACLAEIERLETEFSLYRPDSALRRLNRDGRLEAPSHDMRRLLGESLRFGALSEGAFDVSVQPLWRLYAEHFGAHPEAREGPAPAQVSRALARVDYRRIELTPERVRLGPGMALTLNGIAQGYITDRVADLLRARGWSNVLIDLGEIRALDTRPDGRPWSVRLADPAGPPEPRLALALANRALATSAGWGTPFERSGRHHHLLDPGTGRSRNAYRSVTVLAPRATTADALSTALFLMPGPRAETLLRQAGADAAWLIHADGRRERIAV